MKAKVNSFVLSDETRLVPYYLCKLKKMRLRFPYCHVVVDMHINFEVNLSRYSKVG